MKIKKHILVSRASFIVHAPSSSDKLEFSIFNKTDDYFFFLETLSLVPVRKILHFIMWKSPSTINRQLLNNFVKDFIKVLLYKFLLHIWEISVNKVEEF
jgi:hypothetical protein